MRALDFSKFNLPQVFSSTVLNGSMITGIKSSKIFRSPFKLFLSGFKKISPKKLALSLVIVVIVAAGVLIALSQFGRPTFKQNVTAEVPISRSFQFPITDESGQPTSNHITMNLTTAAKMKNILIQGKPATARTGKTFLIINLEIVNDYQQRLNLAPVDLIRLVDSSGKKFAPDVHNETVVAEPLAIKKTRVGFVIDETTSGLALQIGEINGPKETVSLVL